MQTWIKIIYIYIDIARKHGSTTVWRPYVQQVIRCLQGECVVAQRCGIGRSAFTPISVMVKAAAATPPCHFASSMYIDPQI